MVTAFKRDTFATGVKVNFSDTIFDVLNVTNDYNVVSAFTYRTNADTLFLTNQSSYYDSVLWDLDGMMSSSDSPWRNVGKNGTMTIELFVAGPCGSDISTQTINFQTYGIEDPELFGVHVFPNPVTDRLHIELDDPGSWMAELHSIEGKVVLKSESFRHATDLNVETLPAGNYFLKLIGDKGDVTQSQVTITGR